MCLDLAIGLACRRVLKTGACIVPEKHSIQNHKTMPALQPRKKNIKPISVIMLISFCVEALTDNVYIHSSKSAEHYHCSTGCPEIKNCSGELKEVTLKEAKDEYGRVACRICC
jgi:hypothetical protein